MPCAFDGLGLSYYDRGLCPSNFSVPNEYTIGEMECGYLVAIGHVEIPHSSELHDPALAGQCHKIVWNRNRLDWLSFQEL